MRLGRGSILNTPRRKSGHPRLPQGWWTLHGGLLSNWREWGPVGASRSRWGEINRGRGEAQSQLSPASKYSRGCDYTRQIASQNPDHEATVISSGFMASWALGTQDLESVAKMPCGGSSISIWGPQGVSLRRGLYLQPRVGDSPCSAGKFVPPAALPG